MYIVKRAKSQSSQENPEGRKIVPANSSDDKVTARAVGAFSQPHRRHLEFCCFLMLVFASNAGQSRLLAARTSALGSWRDLILKSRHPLGNA